jgi:hypothetical protein
VIRVFGAVLGAFVVVGTSVGVLQSFAIPRGRVRGAVLLDRAVDFMAAAAGLTVIALQIAYLPSLYGSYNRRETEVTLLAGPARRWCPTTLLEAR